jgi:hypothetical protein
LRNALQGDVTIDEYELAVLEDDDEVTSANTNKLYTSRQVLKYVKGIHHEYHMEKPILKHKSWILKDVPLSTLKTPEFVHQDDPYRRVIDIDWDHVKQITRKDIVSRPVVADDDGWVLDGNHRVTAARAAGFETIPTLIPYTS